DMLEATIGFRYNLKSITSPNGIDFFHGPYDFESPATANLDYITFDVYFKVITDNPNVLAHHTSVFLSDKKSPTYENAHLTGGTFVVSPGKEWIAPVGFDNGDTFVTPGEKGLYYAHD